MPIHYSIKKNGELIHAVGTGVLTEQDLFDYQCSILGDEQIGKKMLELVDLTAAGAETITRAALEKLAIIEGKNGDFFAGWKTAFVVNEELHYGLARMFLAYTGLEGATGHSQAFLEIDEAVLWLGITMNDLERPQLREVK